MQRFSPPTHQQAEEAQQARYASELALLALLASSESGGGAGEDEISTLEKVKLAGILMSLAASVIHTSFSKSRTAHHRDLNNHVVNNIKPRTVAESVLPEAERLYRDISKAKIADENAALSWATWAYSRVAEEVAKTIDKEGFLSSTQALHKVWITRSDRRVRPLHVSLHGKTVHVSDDFWRWPHTGQRLRWPGDKDAPAEATIGCRCVVILTWADQEAVSTTIRKIVEHTSNKLS